jgi:AAA domain
MGEIHWTLLSEVQTKPVQWLWDGRIPFGKVTLLDGEPGSGKSLLALDLAARVSRGAAMPLSSIKPSGPQNVVIFNDDDNLSDTLRPRLEAAGADLSRIRAADCKLSAADVQEIRPALIIVDPLSVYLCLGGADPTRQVLKTLGALARESGAAVLAVQGLPKNAIWASEVFDAARSILQISTIGHGRHRLAVTKSNLEALTGVDAFVYHLEEHGPSVKLAGWADSV